MDNSVSENELLLIKGARNKLTGKSHDTDRSHMTVKYIYPCDEV